jgi:integrase/recombinase XerD
VFVNLWRAPVGAPMRLDAVNDVVTAASRRTGLAAVVTPHQLRHSFGSNVADAEVGLDVVQELLGHASISSTQIYVHQSSGIASDGREMAGCLVKSAARATIADRRKMVLAC